MAWSRAKPRAPAAPRKQAEEAECMAFMDLIARYETAYPDLRFLAHIPNGKKRSKAAAGQLKAMGVKKGVLDYLFFVPRGGFCGYAFEFKSPDGKGDTSTDQDDWIEHLGTVGWKTAVFLHAEEAFAAVMEYLGTGRRIQSTRPARTEKAA
jgi:hypothetical protein